jgi:hypothetical protein
MNSHVFRLLHIICTLLAVSLLIGCTTSPTTTSEKLGCQGTGATNNKCFAQAKGLDFIADQRNVSIFSNGELKRVFSPKGGKGRKIIRVSASGDFLMIHYDNNPEEDIALLFKFSDLQSIFLVGWELPGHLNLGDASSTQEIHGKNISISNGKLYLTDKESQKMIEPGMNMEFTNVCACGDFLVAHEGDNPETGATYIYYYKDANSYPIVNLIRGEHLKF